MFVFLYEDIFNFECFLSTFSCPHNSSNMEVVVKVLSVSFGSLIQVSLNIDIFGSKL